MLTGDEKLNDDALTQSIDFQIMQSDSFGDGG